MYKIEPEHSLSEETKCGGPTNLFRFVANAKVSVVALVVEQLESGTDLEARALVDARLDDRHDKVSAVAPVVGILGTQKQHAKTETENDT